MNHPGGSRRAHGSLHAASIGALRPDVFLGVDAASDHLAVVATRCALPFSHISNLYAELLVKFTERHLSARASIDQLGYLRDDELITLALGGRDHVEFVAELVDEQDR